jgi:hypothetical protein
VGWAAELHAPGSGFLMPAYQLSSGRFNARQTCDPVRGAENGSIPNPPQYLTFLFLSSSTKSHFSMTFVHPNMDPSPICRSALPPRLQRKKALSEDLVGLHCSRPWEDMSIRKERSGSVAGLSKSTLHAPAIISLSLPHPSPTRY